MEPISAIVLSLALGAGAVAGKEIVGAVVKDCYAALKAFIEVRYPSVPVELLEQAPGSTARRAVVEEELAESGAANDAELVQAARELIETIRQQAPGAATAIGSI